jgi:hypothetical protein
MTNDNDIWSDKLEFFFGEEFTRPISPETRLKMLHAVASDLFGKRHLAALKTLETEISLHEILNLLALIISKTYAECGDYFQLADDEALVLIRNQLIRYNPVVISMNKDKRLPKELFH